MKLMRLRRPPPCGQATTEFVVSLVVLVPLFLGIAYAGRYMDIHHAAVQASRYAAFQRVMQPDAGKLSTSDIEDKIRARFFVHGDHLHGGRLQSDDSTSSLADDAGHVPMWRDLGFGQLLSDHKQVTLSVTTESLHDGVGKVGSLSHAGSLFYGQQSIGVQVSNVEVKVANRLDLTASSTGSLLIGASTAAAGGAWNSGGSSTTKAAVKHNPINVPSAVLPSKVTTVLEKVIMLFENEGPKLGCIKTDVVPSDRLTVYRAQDC